MKIKVGDYVYCSSNNEYGFVEKMQDSFVPGDNQIVTVRIEHDGMIQYHYAHQVSIANTDPSDMCEPASDKTVSDEVRQTSDSGAQKGTEGPQFSTSDSGATKQVKKARFDMIPTDALTILAEHYGIGAEKYQPVVNDEHPNGIDNWRLGYQWSLSYAAMQRHATQFWGGEDIDQETGSPHLAAIAWHALAILHWSLNDELKDKYDDRPRM